MNTVEITTRRTMVQRVVDRPLTLQEQAVLDLVAQRLALAVWEGIGASVARAAIPAFFSTPKPTRGELMDVVGPDRHDFYRANGDCLCPVCGKKYYAHPRYFGMRSYDGSYPLRHLCNGDVVKL